MTKTMNDLKNMPIWMLWKKRARGKKMSKIPFAADGRSCGTSENYADRWVPFDEAKQAAAERKADGIGFRIPNGMFFLDIDHRDLRDPFVQEIMALYKSYSDFSVSGQGTHIYGLCDISQLPACIDPKDGKRKLSKDYYMHHPDNGLELYFGELTSRFAVFTGNTSEVPKTITAVMTCSAVNFRPLHTSKKYSSAGKTCFGENGRQTKSSPEKGIFRASSGLLLTFLFHIGTQKCCKFVVIWVRNVIYRCAFRRISAD